MTRKFTTDEIEDDKTYVLVQVEPGGTEKRTKVRAEVWLERHVTFVPLSGEADVTPGPMTLGMWIEANE